MIVLDENLILAVKQQNGINSSRLSYIKRLKWNIFLNLFWVVSLISFILYLVYLFFPLNVLSGWPIYLILFFCLFFLHETIKKVMKFFKELKSPTIRIEEDLFLALKPLNKSKGWEQYYVELEQLGDCAIEQGKLRSLPCRTPIYIIKWGDSDKIVEIYTKEEIQIN